LLTSHIPRRTVDIADAIPNAQLLTVVNMAYDAPSLPEGHR
jgi:hypothetical protein